MLKPRAVKTANNALKDKEETAENGEKNWLNHSNNHNNMENCSFWQAYRQQPLKKNISDKGCHSKEFLTKNHLIFFKDIK